MSGASGSGTSWLENGVLAHTLGVTTLVRPATIYVGLCNTPPTAAVPGTAPAGGGYVRLLTTFAQVAGITNQFANTATLEWPEATAPWGVIGWMELFDASAAGNRYFWGPLVDPADGVTPITRDIAVGDILRVPAGGLVVTAI